MIRHLLKAELTYNRLNLINGYCIFLAGLLLLQVGPQLVLLKSISSDLFILIGLWFMFWLNWAMFIGSFFVTGIHKEKRDRFFAWLPVSRLETAALRILLVLVPWVSNTLLFFLFLWLSGRLPRFFIHPYYFLTFCTHFGVLFFWAGYMVWKRDVKSVFKGIERIFAVPVKDIVSFVLDFFVVLLYLFFIFAPQVKFNRGIVKDPNHPLVKIFSQLFESTTGLAVFFLLGLGMLLLCVFTFLRRKSYTA